MKVKGKNGIGHLLKIILEIGMVVGILLLLFFIPILGVFEISLNWFLGMVYPCGICFLLFVYQFIGLFGSLSNNNPFCDNTVIRLRKGMYLSFVISILVFVSLGIIIGCYSFYTLGFRICMIFIGVLFLGIGLALYILKALFEEAILYKEENDLTI